MKKINNEYNKLLELTEKYEQLVRKYMEEHPEIDEKFKLITRALFSENYVWVSYERTDHTDTFVKIPIKDILNV